MVSEDVQRTSDSTVVDITEEAKLSSEGVKQPSNALLSIFKSLVAGGVAGGVSVQSFVALIPFLSSFCWSRSRCVCYSCCLYLLSLCSFGFAMCIHAPFSFCFLFSFIFFPNFCNLTSALLAMCDKYQSVSARFASFLFSKLGWRCFDSIILLCL